MDAFEHFRNRSVFLTGHTGFKGSWLALWLSELGARVHGYALEPPSPSSLFEEANVAQRLSSHHVGDVRSFGELHEALRAARAEIVFHLAAQPLVRRSYREPRETYETNVMGTANLLEAVRRSDTVRVCQVITTDKCYENREWVHAYRECDPLGGSDPYSSSKACAELVVAGYRESFFSPLSIAEHGISLASARAGNVIGGGDWAQDRIVPDCIRALERREPVLVRNPTAVRPWQHVLEPLSGYLQLACWQSQAPARYADAFNFGPYPAGNVPVRQIVDWVIDAWGEGTWQAPSDAVPGGTPASHEAHFLKLDITKAMTLLPWRPIFSVHEAVQETVRWYRERHEQGERFDASLFCKQQIRRYQDECVAEEIRQPLLKDRAWRS